MYSRVRSAEPRAIFALILSTLASLALLVAFGGTASAQKPAKQTPQAPAPDTAQVLYGYPLTITVYDTTQMDIRYRDPNQNQFYGGNAEGVYLWVNVAGVTKVFGPGTVPAGRSVNPYTPVSNVTTGSGSAGDPWRVTTVVSVPGTPLMLTQRTTYVNGAEFARLDFQLSQVGGTSPMTATLFHAADLYTGGNDSGYGFYDSSTGGVGDYYTQTNGIAIYQQFVPNTPATAYMESYYSTIWNAIGSTSGPGSGFNNTIIANSVDAGAGLQWNLTVPAGGSVTVGDTDLFSPHRSLCGAFSDVPQGSYYYDYVYYLACRGIVSGYTDTTFRPDNVATRGQLSKMVVLGQGWTINTTGGPHFVDVGPENAFYNYIETAYNHGIISGYSDNTFRWGNPVTRGQATKIIVGARGWTINTTGGPHFNDVPTNNAFYQWIETAYNRGIISGYSDGTFRWYANVTRAQLSKILYLALQAP